MRRRGGEKREKREWECEGREGLHATSREKGGGGGRKFMVHVAVW